MAEVLRGFARLGIDSMTVRLSVKRALQRRLRSTYPPIVVASIGRSGSTLLHRAILDARVAASPLPKVLAERVYRDDAWRLNGIPLRAGVVYKTHDTPDPRVPLAGDPKSVFVHGSPIESVRSLLLRRAEFGNDWMAAHLAHLGASASLDEALDRDVLGFEQQLDRWLSMDAVNQVLAVKYDALWSAVPDLRRFLHLEIALPPRRPRQADRKLDPDVESRLRQVYGRLEDRYRELPEVIRLGTTV